MAKKLTLETIGELAGVSRATVSRVINGHPHIRDEVRARVMRVIHETGYQPNHAAQSLASTRSQILGVVIPSSLHSLFSDPYFPRLLQGISRAANAHEYVPSLFLFSNPDEQQRTLQRVIGGGMIDGLIVTADRHDLTLISDLISLKVPLVLVGRPNAEERELVSFVDVDNEGGAYVATTHLIQLGYQRIGTLAVDFNTAGVDRFNGYQRALTSKRISINDHLIETSDFSEMGGYAAMQRLLAAQPDAVFAASDAIAFGALRAIYEAGLRVPDDIAVVGFDDLAPALNSTPPLTTVRQPIEQTGATAAETLIDILHTGIAPLRRIILPTEFVIRASCGAANEAKTAQ